MSKDKKGYSLEDYKKRKVVPTRLTYEEQYSNKPYKTPKFIKELKKKKEINKPKYGFSNIKDLAEHFFSCGHRNSLDIYEGHKKKDFEDYWNEVDIGELK